MKYKSIILTSRGSEEDLQAKIDQALAEFAANGWKLHSQSCWYGEYGETKIGLIKRGCAGEWFKCTLIFEKDN